MGGRQRDKDGTRRSLDSLLGGWRRVCMQHYVPTGLCLFPVGLANGAPYARRSLLTHCQSSKSNGCFPDEALTALGCYVPP